MLNNEEIQVVRDIRIHKILNIPDNGRDIKVNCPFHNERTPSFVIHPDNGYKCFGCDKKGFGAIDFCKDLGYTFKESLDELSKYL